MKYVVKGYNMASLNNRESISLQEYKAIYDNISELFREPWCGMEIMDDICLVCIYACQEDGIPFSCDMMPNTTYKRTKNSDGIEYLYLEFGENLGTEMPLRMGMENFTPGELAEAFHIFNRLPLEWTTGG